MTYHKTATLPAGKTTVNVGDEITYRITAVVAEGSTLDDVVLQDTLGTGLVFKELIAGSEFVQTTPVASPLEFTLAAGTAIGSYSVEYIATVTADATTEVKNAVVATNSQYVCDATIGCEVTTSLSQSDLEVGKAVDNSAPKVGEDVTFTITATNHGASDATNVVVTEQLPSGYTLVSNTASAGTYDPATGLWTIGALANGASATLNITATVLASGDYANTATITGGEHDPTPGNNTSTNTPTPEASADLDVEKTVDNPAPY